MDSLQSRLSLERETVVSFVTEVFLRLSDELFYACSSGAARRPANRTDATAHRAVIPPLPGSHLTTSANSHPVQVHLKQHCTALISCKINLCCRSQAEAAVVAARLPLEDSDTEDSVISSNALSRFVN